MKKMSIRYKTPFDYEGLFKSYENHKVGDLERFVDGRMHRVIAIGGNVGQISIANDHKNSKLLVTVDFPDESLNAVIISRIKKLFDVDADPTAIATGLGTNRGIKKLLKKFPGIRIPTGWEPFEIAIATILGQLVSMEQCRALVRDLIQIAGQESGLIIEGKKIKLFPTPQQIVDADLSLLKTTRQRKQTLVNFARAILKNEVSLDPDQNVDVFLKNILAIKGIGPWTAHYIALKALRYTDSFPSSDLILARALELHPGKVVEKMRPWRGYAAALFWRSYSHVLTRKRGKKV